MSDTANPPEQEYTTVECVQCGAEIDDIPVELADLELLCSSYCVGEAGHYKPKDCGEIHPLPCGVDRDCPRS